MCWNVSFVFPKTTARINSLAIRDSCVRSSVRFLISPHLPRTCALGGATLSPDRTWDVPFLGHISRPRTPPQRDAHNSTGGGGGGGGNDADDEVWPVIRHGPAAICKRPVGKGDYQRIRGDRQEVRMSLERR